MSILKKQGQAALTRRQQRRAAHRKGIQHRRRRSEAIGDRMEMERQRRYEGGAVHWGGKGWKGILPIFDRNLGSLVSLDRKRERRRLHEDANKFARGEEGGVRWKVRGVA